MPDYERLLAEGTKANLAKLTLGRMPLATLMEPPIVRMMEPNHPPHPLVRQRRRLQKPPRPLNQWETTLTRAVQTIKGRYQSLKELDLLTMLRAANNQVCGSPGSVEQIVAPYIDQAMTAVAAKDPTLVRVAPPFYAPATSSCRTALTTPPVAPKRSPRP